MIENPCGRTEGDRGRPVATEAQGEHRPVVSARARPGERAWLAGTHLVGQFGHFKDELPVPAREQTQHQPGCKSGAGSQKQSCAGSRTGCTRRGSALLVGDGAAVRNLERQHRQHEDLGRESLRGCHSDLGPRVEVHAAVRLAGDRRAHGVDDAEDLRAAPSHTAPSNAGAASHGEQRTRPGWTL